MRFWDFGFRVSVLESRIYGDTPVSLALIRELKWCRVQGAGCRVQGAGCRVHGSGFRVQGTGLGGYPGLALALIKELK